jgi:hypothetical protein
VLPGHKVRFSAIASCLRSELPSVFDVVEALNVDWCDAFPEFCAVRNIRCIQYELHENSYAWLIVKKHKHAPSKPRRTGQQTCLTPTTTLTEQKKKIALT